MGHHLVPHKLGVVIAILEEVERAVIRSDLPCERYVPAAAGPLDGRQEAGPLHGEPGDRVLGQLTRQVIRQYRRLRAHPGAREVRFWREARVGGQLLCGIVAQQVV
jgi:hypothetical protein